MTRHLLTYTVALDTQEEEGEVEEEVEEKEEEVE